MNPQLSQIADLIKTRQFDQARQLIERYLEQRPDDAWAWYLRSFVETGHARKLDAARRALSLAPDHDQLQARLAKLQAMQPHAGNPARRWRLFAVFGVAILAIITGSVLALRNGAQSSDAPLPTLAVLAMPTPQTVLTASVAEISSLTEDRGAEATSVDLPASVEATSIETEDEGVAAAPTDAAISVEATVIVQSDNPVSLPSPDVPLINVGEATATTESQPEAAPVVTEQTPADSPSDSSTPTLPVRPTRPGSTTATPAVLPTAAPTVAPPLFDSITDPGVPVSLGLDVGTGEMRIVSATRPAKDRITELGGSVPNAPGDQSWVLVEALLICAGDLNCRPNPSALWVVGSSGAGYNPSPQLNLPPIFGSALSNRQVWGYLGFVVPTNESNLRLVLVQGGQTFVFALQ